MVNTIKPVVRAISLLLRLGPGSDLAIGLKSNESALKYHTYAALYGPPAKKQAWNWQKLRLR